MPPPGQKIGINGVKSGGMIGKGGSACVYKCKVEAGEPKIPINAALKEFSVMAQRDPEAKEAQEVALNQLLMDMKECLLVLPPHPNLVKYYGVELAKGQLSGADRVLVTMEWVEGASKRPKMTLTNEKLAQHVAKCVLSAVVHLHTHGVTHDSLYLGNVFVTADVDHVDAPPIVKVTDHGIFKKVMLLNDPVGGAATTKQMPQYTAPEVFTDGNSYDPCKVDIWGVGVTLVELLTGHPPYYELDPTGKQNIMFKIVGSGKPPKYADGLSPKCVDFLNQCFNRDFNRRPDAVTLQKHEWLSSVIPE